jgi:hypothetical protein
MALTALKVKDLADKGFVGLFDDHRDLWRTKAKEAYDYAKKYILPAGEPVRPDDVLPLLVPALEVNDTFRGFLEEERLTQLYWRSNFAEYILDRFWTDLTKEAERAEQEGR